MIINNIKSKSKTYILVQRKRAVVTVLIYDKLRILISISETTHFNKTYPKSSSE